MAPRNHDTGPSGVTVDQLIDRIFPIVDDLLRQLAGDEFTTTQFIELMQSVPGAVEAYSQALVAWGEGDRPGKMVIHGQIIPGALRRSKRVEWIGFAHGEADDYAVPAWWKLKQDDE